MATKYDVAKKACAKCYVNNTCQFQGEYHCPVASDIPEAVGHGYTPQVYRAEGGDGSRYHLYKRG